MSVNYTDFDKIWASTSPLTPYEFSESQYKEGWNFVGETPPSRQMWDSFMKNADEKIQYLYNHESVPVGHEYFTFNPNVPQGSLPLFGGEYSRETYSALWNWVQEQTGYLKTEAEWQQLYTTNAGNVPYYSDGDGSTTFRVPSLKCWIKAANGTVSEVGSYLEAGLPNITGGVMVSPEGEGSCPHINYSGALAKQATSGVYKFTHDGVEYGVDWGISLDASRSSSIYGNSTTVQPPSIVGMWLVKAYGVVEDTGSIDEQQYIDDRMNAMTQYVNDSVGAVNTRLGTVLEVSGNSTTVGTEDILCEITTHPAGTWLIISHMILSYSASSIYNHTITPANHNGITTRNSSVNGGGNSAVLLTMLDENEKVSTKGYQTQAGTMRGRLMMVRLA